MADSGRHNELAAIVRAEFPGVRITSGFRPGAKGHHGTGNAVDLGDPAGPRPNGSPFMANVNKWIADNYPGSTELIYTPGINLFQGKPHTYNASTRAQHFNHVHWALVGSIQAARAGGAGGGSGAEPPVVEAGGPIPDFVPFADSLNSLIATVNFITKAAEFFTNPKMWFRVGLFLLGLLGLGLAVAALVRKKLAAPKDVLKTVRKVVPRASA